MHLINKQGEENVGKSKMLVENDILLKSKALIKCSKEVFQHRRIQIIHQIRERRGDGKLVEISLNLCSFFSILVIEWNFQFFDNH